ncbi:hypothetical protein EDC04DRAFT_2871431 [Pisolithus marmoratus]|nr:hypothetical protein EDC04DRAFT_2871431 [Pisolithus marmoratus]
MHSRPDKPLLVKCAFDSWNKRISFASARNCSYDLLRERIEQCFSLSATPYVISYRDDDGEVTDITTEADLTEAIQYFQAGSDDPPLSSAASILSGRSFGSKRITLRVHITVDYDGPSLSDTSSLVSLDEYRGRNESSSELNWAGAPGVGGNDELEDDTVTVSSRDNIAHRTADAPTQRAHQAELDSFSFSIPEEGGDEAYQTVSIPSRSRKPKRKSTLCLIGLPSRVRSPSRNPFNPSVQDRGAAWLRDQNARAIRAMLGTSPQPSDDDCRSTSLSRSDGQYPEGSMGGDLALQRDRRGRYYYSYTALQTSPLNCLPFVIPTSPPPGSLTTCSECGVLLDAIRYVCATCGEKEPASCSSILRGPIPGWYPRPRATSSVLGASRVLVLYHALQESTERMDDPESAAQLSEDALSLWLRSAPRQKGKMRHAYFERVWGPQGWEDVVRPPHTDHSQSRKICSHANVLPCNSTIVNKRFKCASCKKFNLCRACYNQVHDIHPAHSFLIVLGKPTQPRPEVDVTYVVNGSNGEPSSGSEMCPVSPNSIRSSCCLQDIVGARFHCAICDSVDICSNCEAVGLPGNLDPSDGGHTSSHIMIKIPYPLESSEVRTASRRAIHLWTGRDAAQVLTAPRSKPSSVYSSYAQTIVGSRMQLDLQDDILENHRINCNGCNETIFGIRYQCATCPSVSTPYSLYLSFLVHSAALCDRCMERIRGAWYRCAYCAKDLCGDCEAVDTHDETHVFVVFKAPVGLSFIVC